MNQAPDPISTIFVITQLRPDGLYETASAMRHLEEYLGTEQFDRVMILFR